jgi:hypothetical protein
MVASARRRRDEGEEGQATTRTNYLTFTLAFLEEIRYNIVMVH